MPKDFSPPLCNIVVNSKDPLPHVILNYLGESPLKRNGSGSVGVLKYAIGYFRLPYFRFFRIFPGICLLSERFYTFFHPEAQGLSSIL